MNVMIVEDRDMIRHGLEMLIDGTEGYQCVGAYRDCESMLEDIEALSPDIILMDIDLPGMSGIEGIKRIKDISPDYTILVLTIYEENEMIFEALCAGASGYLVKKTPPAQLLEAIRDACEGGAPMSSHIARKVVDFFQQSKLATGPEPSGDDDLTPREIEVLRRLVEGDSSRAIADALCVSVETVRFHFRNIYKKLHVHSKSEAVAKAIRRRLV
ncbi:MAG: response regulator transcription factor [Calditrichaeota bacterium]|nr:response regulator transcription factor [Calditrichota bacterium]MCB9089486.1 response regulator transcription factor [Calditrichia bacterium]